MHIVALIYDKFSHYFFSHKRADVYPVNSKVIEHSYDYVIHFVFKILLIWGHNEQKKDKMLTHHCSDLPNYSKYRLYLKLEIVESTRVVISKKNLETIVKLCLSEFLGQKMFKEYGNVSFTKIIVFSIQCILQFS